MSSAARSVYVFGIYLLVIGGVLLGSPDTFMSILQLPASLEPWPRILGVVVMALGMYYVAGARSELTPFFRATVRIRAFAMVSFIVLGVLQLVAPIIIGFGLIDGACALWTHFALRQESAVRQPLTS